MGDHVCEKTSAPITITGLIIMDNEFNHKKKLLELEKENIELKYKLKLETMIFERESNRLFHERELERGRIKSAEIRKSFERKQSAEFANSTSHR